jgi:hypothetical protein
MKRLINKVGFVSIILLLIGCSEADISTEELQDATTRGTVLKTLETNLKFQIGEENLISISAEVIDQRGQDVEKIDVFISFSDTSTEDEDPNNISKDEALFKSVPASDFDTNNEYPIFNFAFTGTEFDEFFNFTEVDYAGGGRINIRLELVMNDGRVFTSDNVSGIVSGGAFYLSPFQYDLNLLCEPANPADGVWNVELQDSYGDGWNGAELIISLDGEETSFTIEEGSSQSNTIVVLPTTEIISIKYSAGSFDGEVTFQVTASNGNVVVDAGPSPSAGPELINYCDTNSYQ